MVGLRACVGAQRAQFGGALPLEPHDRRVRLPPVGGGICDGAWSRKDEVAVAELVPAVAALARGLVAVLDQLVSRGRREHLEVR